MTENRATAKPLSFEEHQALLAQLPDYMVEAIKQTGSAVDRRVQEAIMAMMELRTMLDALYRLSMDGDTDGLFMPNVFSSLLKILPDAETDGGLTDIYRAVYETALPMLVAGMASSQPGGKKHGTKSRATLPGLTTAATV